MAVILYWLEAMKNVMTTSGQSFQIYLPRTGFELVTTGLLAQCSVN